MFRGSSVVEQPTVNRLVVGSNPTRGATRGNKALINHAFYSPNFATRQTTRQGDIACRPFSGFFTRFQPQDHVFGRTIRISAYLDLRDVAQTG